MIDAVYNTKLLELAGNIGAVARLDDPQATAKRHSKLCGSTVTVDVSVGADGAVVAYGQDVKACALGQASAAIVAAGIIGATPQELRAARDEAYAMLKADGQPPEGRFADMRYLQPVKDYKARHASTLLVFDAVVDALDQIDSQQSAA
ncbi:MAG: iron-sulfur cluster assembly scaffold protein [Ahrensia sp.]